MNKELFKCIIKNKADLWLKENPLLLNSKEKQKFLMGLQNYLDSKTITIDDEVFDFLVQQKLVQNEPREKSFEKYLIKKYESVNGLNILDVGAGRTCTLSKILATDGAKMTAMDVNIRICNDDLRRMRIKALKNFFRCDEYSKNGRGTDVKNFDIIVGLEPCDATEHIIRQALKYDKPFDVCLCVAPHKGLNGLMFGSFEEWYNYLKSISKEVTILEQGNNFIATNSGSLER